MRQIFVNLKRFEVPRAVGGVCPSENPEAWTEFIIDLTVKYGVGVLEDLTVTFLLPEALILTAYQRLNSYPADWRRAISLGCQSVYREDIKPGGNFGAFTSNRPATAARNLGCLWTIIGHSEERRDKQDLIQRFEPSIAVDAGLRKKANDTVSRIMNEEVLTALNAGLHVLLCVGETAAERGEGDFEVQKSRIETALKDQLLLGLKDVTPKLNPLQLVIGYEPIWAIGPGKSPPGGDYISFVSQFIKKTVKDEYGFEPPVVYGGGLKEENAAMIAKIATIDGGLVALTRFTGEIGFEPEGLKRIIDKYLE